MEKERKKEIESLLGAVDDERFSLLVNLGKKLTDWSNDQIEKNNANNVKGMDEDDNIDKTIGDEEDEKDEDFWLQRKLRFLQSSPNPYLDWKHGNVSVESLSLPPKNNNIVLIATLAAITSLTAVGVIIAIYCFSRGSTSASVLNASQRPAS